MNSICFDAFIPGNHEFDDGDATLKSFLDELARGDCQTPTLSANIVPAAGSPLSPDGRPPYLKPYLIKTIGGVKVGLIGITTARKTVESSRPLASTQFNDETTAAQQAIDTLKVQGVRHIVVVTHQGYETDKALAAALTDVDVIIGGDSHTLLGDFFRRRRRQRRRLPDAGAQQIGGSRLHRPGLGIRQSRRADARALR